MDVGLDQTSAKRIWRRGFSYLDVMVAIVIIAVGVVALMQSMTTSSEVHATARQVEVAVNLTRHMHEYGMTLSMTKLDALNGKTFTTPIGSDGQQLVDASGKVLPAYAGWEQRTSVVLVPVKNIRGFGPGSPSDPPTRFRRLTVEARYKGGLVHREYWLLAPVGL